MDTSAIWDEDVELSADERFFEVILANEDLLLAEFDAIILEEWPDPPPPEPDGGDDAQELPSPVTRGLEPRPAETPTTHRPAVQQQRRQRSPPRCRRRTAALLHEPAAELVRLRRGR